MKKYVLTVVATCSGYLYRVLGQGVVNCWGALIIGELCPSVRSASIVDC